MSMLSGLTALTSDIGKSFGNIAPLLQATGVIKTNNINNLQDVTNPPKATVQSGSNTMLYLGIGAGVLVLLVVVVVVARKK